MGRFTDNVEGLTGDTVLLPLICGVIVDENVACLTGESEEPATEAGVLILLAADRAFVGVATGLGSNSVLTLMALRSRRPDLEGVPVMVSAPAASSFPLRPEEGVNGPDERLDGVIPLLMSLTHWAIASAVEASGCLILRGVETALEVEAMRRMAGISSISDALNCEGDKPDAFWKGRLCA